MTGSIERVVIPLEAASDDLTALDTAARVSAHAKVPLHDIFIEDEDLLHLAALPFARQVTAHAGTQSFTSEQAHLQLRAAAERARRELISAAKRHGVKHSFEIIRGSQNALLETTEGDVIVAGAELRPIAGHFRIERRWSTSVATVRGAFLLARHSWAEAGSVVALLRDRTASSARLLATAARLAGARDGRLTVICAAALADQPGFAAWLDGRFAGLPVQVDVEIVPADPQALQQRLSQLQCRLLAVEIGAAEGFDERLREFAQHFGCDVLVIR